MLTACIGTQNEAASAAHVRPPQRASSSGRYATVRCTSRRRARVLSPKLTAMARQLPPAAPPTSFSSREADRSDAPLSRVAIRPGVHSQGGNGKERGRRARLRTSSAAASDSFLSQMRSGRPVVPARGVADRPGVTPSAKCPADLNADLFVTASSHEAPRPPTDRVQAPRLRQSAVLSPSLSTRRWPRLAPRLAPPCTLTKPSTPKGHRSSSPSLQRRELLYRRRRSESEVQPKAQEEDAPGALA